MKKNVEGRNTPMGVFTARQLREWLLVVNVMSIIHTFKTVGQVEYFEKYLTAIYSGIQEVFKIIHLVKMSQDGKFS